MDKTKVIERLRAREASLVEELDEVRTLLKTMEKPTRPGRSVEAMAAMREAKAKKD